MFKHLTNVCMTYSKHFSFSMNLSKIYLKSSYKAFIHAILPNIYITSSSDTQKEVDLLLKNSGCIKKKI